MAMGAKYTRVDGLSFVALMVGSLGVWTPNSKYDLSTFRGVGSGLRSSAGWRRAGEDAARRLGDGILRRLLRNARPRVCLDRSSY